MQPVNSTYQDRALEMNREPQVYGGPQYKHIVRSVFRISDVDTEAAKSTNYSVDGVDNADIQLYWKRNSSIRQ